MVRLARALLQGGDPLLTSSLSFGGLGSESWTAPLTGSSGSVKHGMSSTVMIIVSVVCTVLVIVAVGGTLFALRRHKQRAAREAADLQRQRVEARRKEVDEAANRTREVVIPIIVLGPDEALHVAFDDAYLDALAAGAEADEGLECGSHCAIDAAAAAAGHACCAAGQSACGGSQEEHMQQQQAVEEPWAPGFQASIGRSSSSCRSSSSSGSAAGSPGVGQSLVQRVQCRVSQSVLSVANLMATPAAEAEAEEAEEGSVSPSPSLAAASDDGQS